MREYRQKGGSRKQPSREQIERLRKLGEERQSVLDEVIGARLNGLELANALLMNPNACDTDLAFLPEERRDAAYRALCDAKVAYVHGIDAWDEEGKQLEEKRVAALSDILSPEESEEFRMRINPAAHELRSSITYLECTPDEFKALLTLREQRYSATNRPNDPYLEEAGDAAAFGRLFGEARAREARRNLILHTYNGNQTMLQLVTDGMVLCPNNPNFIQARDAIFQADVVDCCGMNGGYLAQAFARRGLGVLATADPVFESFDPNFMLCACQQ